MNNITYKLAFRFERNSYSVEDRLEINEGIKNELQSRLADKEIRTIRIYAPSRNSIKAIFPNETELNKVLEHNDYFQRKGLTTKLSMAHKANCTVFCTGFDYTILSSYNKNYILEHLQRQGWG